jgi:hypothetical protein
VTTHLSLVQRLTIRGAMPTFFKYLQDMTLNHVPVLQLYSNSHPSNTVMLRQSEHAAGEVRYDYKFSVFLKYGKLFSSSMTNTIIKPDPEIRG